LDILNKEGYYKGPRGAWDSLMQKAFAELCHTLNMEERDVDAGHIDREVLEYLQKTYRGT
jgi:hypothetical protein